MYCISVENLHKVFKIYNRPQDRLKELILRKPQHRDFHVLQDISFSVLHGKSLGIIGDNGAGKSTLLKLLVGTLQPTGGTISVTGQVAALLELGAGFHPDFTGRKNIYLNASLLGVPDDDIQRLEKDIIEFSELEYFIDSPVKTYSSGMYVRLAFSIATMVRPDILVIDEALSVGDIAFQKKCVQRMMWFREQGKTMVFCSHSMYHVQELCDTTIWLERGRIKEIGNSEEVVSHYEDYCDHKKEYYHNPEQPAGGAEQAEGNASKDCRVLSVQVKSVDGAQLESVEPLADILLEMQVEILHDNTVAYFAFAFMKTLDDVISSYVTVDKDQLDNGPFNKGEKLTVQLKVKSLALRTGQFYVLGGVADESGLLWYETKLSKAVKIVSNKGVGPLLMESEWTIKKGTGC